MKIRNWHLFIIYIIIVLALFPLFQYEYFYWTSALDQASSFWVWFRIILSGPLLITAGVILLFFIKGKHRFFGAICLFTSIYWLSKIIQDMV